MYLYMADIYCDECGNKIMGNLDLPKGFDPSNECTWESDEYPKGPYPDSTEADYPIHCAKCGEFMENNLTEDGRYYLLRTLVMLVKHPTGTNKEIVEQWIDYYDVTLTEFLDWCISI